MIESLPLLSGTLPQTDLGYARESKVYRISSDGPMMRYDSRLVADPNCVRHVVLSLRDFDSMESMRAKAKQVLEQSFGVSKR